MTYREATRLLVLNGNAITRDVWLGHKLVLLADVEVVGIKTRVLVAHYPEIEQVEVGFVPTHYDQFIAEDWYEVY